MQLFTLRSAAYAVPAGSMTNWSPRIAAVCTRESGPCLSYTLLCLVPVLCTRSFIRPEAPDAGHQPRRSGSEIVGHPTRWCTTLAS